MVIKVGRCNICWVNIKFQPTFPAVACVCEAPSRHDRVVVLQKKLSVFPTLCGNVGAHVGLNGVSCPLRVLSAF